MGLGLLHCHRKALCTGKHLLTHMELKQDWPYVRNSTVIGRLNIWNMIDSCFTMFTMDINKHKSMPFLHYYLYALSTKTQLQIST